MKQLPPSHSPGVYVTELEPSQSMVGVPTAVPAFIGYTQKADLSGSSVLNKPIAIDSLADYEEIFGQGMKPEFSIDEVTGAGEIDAGNFDFKVFDPDTQQDRHYSLMQTSDSRFNLYNSIRLFYANGGGKCYVVSVGLFLDHAGTPVQVDADTIQKGLSAIEQQQGPTILVVPDAVLLPSGGSPDTPWVSPGFQQIARSMLEQCGRLQDRVALLDVYGTEAVTQSNLNSVIGEFRETVEVDTLLRSYGMAYFPFLNTTLVPVQEITHANIADSALPTLQKVLGWQNTQLHSADAARLAAIQTDIDAMASTNTAERVTQIDQTLSANLQLLPEIKTAIAEQINHLPPSGAMAGVFTHIDQSRGVWNAPANVSLQSVAKPTFPIDDKTQVDLNQPLDGKAVDVIREFTGRGTVVWGARTLDGNSNDYRYIQVRRTLIYIEQSINQALQPFVFAANDGETWSAVISLISGFLQDLWSQGCLMGATPQEAFTVECGIGSTMTANDVLEGYMIVQVTLQMIRPAEFIELTFKQKMES